METTAGSYAADAHVGVVGRCPTRAAAVMPPRRAARGAIEAADPEPAPVDWLNRLLARPGPRGRRWEVDRA
jgi:hypothetical protein